jgi:hypothetical protein
VKLADYDSCSGANVKDTMNRHLVEYGTKMQFISLCQQTLVVLQVCVYLALVSCVMALARYQVGSALFHRWATHILRYIKFSQRM